MRRAMDIRVLVLVEPTDTVDPALRLLRCRRVIEPHKRLAVYALIEDGKIAPCTAQVKETARQLQIVNEIGIVIRAARGNAAAALEQRARVLKEVKRRCGMDQ